MSGGGGKDSKWPCERCTYLNYSSAGRCTMCANARPQHHIIPTTTSARVDMEPRTPSPPHTPPHILVDSTEKWACSKCTYLNYPRAIRCCQCYELHSTSVAVPSGSPSIVAPAPEFLNSPPQHASPVSDGSLSQSPPKADKLNTTPPLQTTVASINKSRHSPPLKSRVSPPLKSRQSPPLKSPSLKYHSHHHHQNSPKGRRSPPKQLSSRQCSRAQAASPNNRVNHETQTSPTTPTSPRAPDDQQKQHLLSHKWCCPACTYENWPRSSRCIMCALPKRLGNSHDAASVEATSPSPATCGAVPSSPEGDRQGKHFYQSPTKLQGGRNVHNAGMLNSCSTSVGLKNISSDVNTSIASTNTSCERTEEDASQSRFIVSSSEVSNRCASINLINKNRSEACGNQHNHEASTACSISSMDVSSVSLTPSSNITTTTTCSTGGSNSSGNIAVSASCCSPVMSCSSTAATHSSASPPSAAVVVPSPNSNSQQHYHHHHHGNHNISGAGGASNNREASSDSSVRGRAGEGAMALNNYETERLLRQLRRRLRDTDLAFLNACLAVVEGNYEPVEMYLSAGGDPMRPLTSTDVKLLARPSAFDEGITLVHLAIRFGREDLLDTILSGIHGGGCGVKRVPCYVAPELANDIRRSVAASIRQRRDSFPCYCVSEFVTYSLPPEVEMLGSSSAQDRLWEELLDRDVQKQLEEDAPIINWSLELTDRLGSRLFALWNRTAGDCLLDSVLQATWGVFDRDNCLRRALAASLTEAAHLLYPRWREHERLQARLLDYAVPENVVLEEWAELVCLASQPGAALDQLHIFVLAHIMRRPIIVYGVKCVKSFRGEDLGYARFEGVYLPLLWDSSFCCKSPIALGYTRGHFCALVPICPQPIHAPAAGAILEPGDSQLVFLPLTTHEAKLLPVHFVTQAEMGCEAALLREWLDVCQSETGLLVAQQRLHKKPLPVAQMTEEWLNYYRTMAQMEGAPFSRPITSQGYSSDGDSEEE